MKNPFGETGFCKKAGKKAGKKGARFSVDAGRDGHIFGGLRNQLNDLSGFYIADKRENRQPYRNGRSMWPDATKPWNPEQTGKR